MENLFSYTDGVFKPILAQPSEHIEFVKSLNSDRFNVCLDIGHSAITGVKPQDAVSGMNKNILKALHIHDNDFTADGHLMPYLGKFEWDEICSALKSIGYEGELTFEIFGTLNKIPNEALFDALCFARKIGEVLIGKIKSDVKNHFLHRLFVCLQKKADIALYPKSANIFLSKRLVL